MAFHILSFVTEGPTNGRTCIAFVVRFRVVNQRVVRIIAHRCRETLVRFETGKLPRWYTRIPTDQFVETTALKLRFYQA